MLTVAKLDSKNPNQSFQSDRAEKKRIASETPAIRKAVSELSELHAEACPRSAWKRRDQPPLLKKNDGPRH